jgi:hypothetical protein
MDEISTQKNLNYIEKTITSDNKKNLSDNDITTQPSDQAIQAILNYSKSLCVLKSENKNKTKLCNIN